MADNNKGCLQNVQSQLAAKSPSHTGKDSVRTVLGHATIRNFVQKIRSIPDRNTVLGHVLTLSWVS